MLVVLDDFSRFVVRHALCDSPTSDVATATLRAAIACHGLPEEVRTDRGGAFVANKEETDFAHYLEAELVDHVVGHAYHPQGRGKVESAIGTLKRELWAVFEFHDREEATRRLDAFFEDYNHRRGSASRGARWQDACRGLSHLRAPVSRRHPSELSLALPRETCGQQRGPVGLSESLGGKVVGLQQLDDVRWNVWFRDVDCGQLEVVPSWLDHLVPQSARRESHRPVRHDARDRSKPPATPTARRARNTVNFSSTGS